MASPELHVVTGALGYSGSHIATRLLGLGRRVRTLTNRAASAADPRLEIHPLRFDDPDGLTESLRGAAALYNTYWVRFNHRGFTRAGAVRNTLRLFECARAAGVGRILHVSITNPSEDSPFEYFRCKAELENALAATGVPHAILRPAVLFGGDDILINNIAWTIRRLPVVGVFGDGRYRIQPIHVDDLACLAVEHGAPGPDAAVVNAIGPETFTYRGLVETIAEIIGKRRPIVSVPPSLGYLAARLLGLLVRDVVLTRDEIDALMAGLLHVDAPPAGTTRLTEWARDHADDLGRRYASELARRGAGRRRNRSAHRRETRSS